MQRSQRVGSAARWCAGALPVLASVALRIGAADAVPGVLLHASFEGTLDAVGAAGPVAPIEVVGRREFRPGKVGQALLCGGDAALVKYPVAGHLRPSQGTIEMWVQPVDWPDGEQAFHVFFETEGPGWLVLYQFWTGGLLLLSGSDHEHFGSAWRQDLNLRPGQWYHLAGVWSLEAIRLYVDGVLVKQHPLPPLPAALAGSFLIGDAPWSKPHASHTLVDEVRIYPCALPAEQIALAAQGKPVTYHLSLPVTVTPFPVRKQWHLTVDASAFLAPAGPGNRVAVEVLANGAPLARSETTSFADGVGNVTVDMAAVPPGEHVARVRVLDPAGNAVATAEVPCQRPPDPPWLGNTIGLEDQVLKPFTEVQVAAGSTTAECWGRAYVLDGLLPSQVRSLGEPLLARPVSLLVRTAEGDVALRTVATSVARTSPTRAEHAATAAAPGLEVKTASALEYDGLLWTELTLTPAQAIEVAELALEVPVLAARGLYLHHVGRLWGQNDTGLVPAEGYESKAFMPLLWLGDDDRGLAWFAESAEGWSNAPGQPVVRVQHGEGAVTLRVNLINQPTRLEKPLRLAFGLQATPVKPRPPDARRWRLGNLGTAENLKDPSMGTLQVIWPNGNLLAYGYPWPRAEEPFRALVADLHAKGIRVLPYVNLNFLALDTPEWPAYSPEWRDPGRSFVDGDVGQMGHGTIGACPHSAAWRDLVAWNLARFVDEFQVDGIYVDCWNPWPCTIEEHGCGWRDAGGTLQGQYRLRDCREIMRRVRSLFEARRPEPHIIIHMSTTVAIPMLSFADSMLDGEQYQGELDPKDDYLAVVPLDKWRAQNTGLQWGVLPFFLPEFVGPHRRERLPTERLMGIMLAHDASPWPIWCNAQVVFDVWTAVDGFGIAGAEFLPYWKSNGVSTGSSEVVASVYRKAASALLVVLNAGKADTEVKLTVDPARLGLAPGTGLRPAEAGAATVRLPEPLPLQVAGRGYGLVIAE